jgi:hypothetical protein
MAGEGDGPASRWLKLAVITAGVVAIALVVLAFRSSGSTNSAGPASDTDSIRSVAVDYCNTKAALLAAMEAPLATDPSTDPAVVVQQSSDSLSLMQDDIGQLQDEASRAGDAGDSALSSELDDLAHGLQDLHDGIESMDPNVNDISARVVPLVTAVNNSAPVQAQCPGETP